MLFEELSHSSGCFVRRIQRKTDWNPEDGGIEDIVARIFPFSAEDKYSLYWVDNDRSLEAVVGGLILSRQNVQNIDLLCFSRDEMSSAEITYSLTPGDTPCHFANGYHVDIIAEPAQLCQLCELAKKKERKHRRMGKKGLKLHKAKLLDSVRCTHDDCHWCKDFERPLLF